MRQAIETKYLGPTNYRGSRIVAKAQAGKRIYDWDDGLGVDENHEKAATHFAQALGWKFAYLRGGGNAKGDGYVFVLVEA